MTDWTSLTQLNWNPVNFQGHQLCLYRMEYLQFKALSDPVLKTLKSGTSPNSSQSPTQSKPITGTYYQPEQRNTALLTQFQGFHRKLNFTYTTEAAQCLNKEKVSIPITSRLDQGPKEGQDKVMFRLDSQISTILGIQ